MARERIVKDTPKRGKLQRSEVKRVVAKIVHRKCGGGEIRQPYQSKRG